MMYIKTRREHFWERRDNINIIQGRGENQTTKQQQGV